jgi:hypothetical protein
MFDRLSEATAGYLNDSDLKQPGFWTGASKKSEDHDSSGKPKGGAA